METVSVVIPCYNPKKYLFETIKSIYRQTRKADEIIIVDDGSNEDNSKVILQEVLQKYPDIKFIRQNNRGISGAVNAGAKMTTGSIVFPVDCDDVLHSQYIEKYLEAFQQDSTIDAVTAPYIAFKGEGKFDKTCEILYTYKPKGLILPDIFLDNFGGGSNSAFRKSMLEEIGYFEEMYTSFQDWGMWFKLIAYDKKLKVLKKPLYYYRIHGESDTRNNLDEKFLQFYKNFQISLNLINNKRPEFFVKGITYPILKDYKKVKMEETREIQLQLQAKMREIELMRSSKFWKLRNAYLCLKKSLIEIPLLVFSLIKLPKLAPEQLKRPDFLELDR